MLSTTSARGSKSQCLKIEQALSIPFGSAQSWIANWGLESGHCKGLPFSAISFRLPAEVGAGSHPGALHAGRRIFKTTRRRLQP